MTNEIKAPKPTAIVASPLDTDLYRRWSDMGGRCERNKLPGILWDLYECGAFTVGEQDGHQTFDTPLLAVAVEDAWSSAEYPEGALEAYQWVDLFHTADEHLSYPHAPVTLYRGARDEDGMRGMSWTSSMETARWFANRFGGTGVVYRITDVGPEHVLAQIARGRPEDEYVLDPGYLEGAPVETLGSDGVRFPTVVSRALRRDAGIITVQDNRDGYRVRQGLKDITALSISVSVGGDAVNRHSARDLLAILAEAGWDVRLDEGGSILYVDQIGGRS
jgi:hypothetical protein